MISTRSAVLPALVLGAAASLVSATAIAASGTHESRVAGSNDYKISTSANGSGMNVNITVNGDWHINKAYPVKFNSKPVDTSKITYSGPADNPNALIANITDAKAGKIKFGYCKADGSSCAFGEEDVKL